MIREDVFTDTDIEAAVRGLVTTLAKSPHPERFVDVHTVEALLRREGLEGDRLEEGLAVSAFALGEVIQARANGAEPHETVAIAVERWKPLARAAYLGDAA